MLDGGGGSNFLTGAADPSSVDQFFVDGCGNAVTWSTIVNFHPGDSATIFGFKADTLGKGTANTTDYLLIQYNR